MGTKAEEEGEQKGNKLQIQTCPLFAHRTIRNPIWTVMNDYFLFIQVKSKVNFLNFVLNLPIIKSIKIVQNFAQFFILKGEIYKWLFCFYLNITKSKDIHSTVITQMCLIYKTDL